MPDTRKISPLYKKYFIYQASAYLDFTIAEKSFLHKILGFEKSFLPLYIIF